MPAKRLKICERGHKFYKSSDCPTCPICAAQDRPESGFLSLLSAPARGALEHVGITTLTELSQHTEREILKLHGMGPKSLPVLQKALQEAGLAFAAPRLKPVPLDPLLIRRLEMNIPWRTIIWQQFGAAIDDLDNALRACPDELWRARLWNDPAEEKFFLPEYWYIVYHALFWLDLYLTGAEEGFAPPAPFTLIEQNEEGPLPERPYSKEELQAYLVDCRRKCQATIESMTDEAAQRHCRFGWGEVSFAGLLLYNMRHVQGHAAQLNLLLGQKVGSAPGWVIQAGS